MTPIVGHTVVYDNMGIGGLTHPASCTAIHRGADCPVTRSLLHAPRIHGYNGRGKYLAVLGEDQIITLHPVRDVAAAAAEITPLLGAFTDQVGLVAANQAVLLWWLDLFDIGGADMEAMVDEYEAGALG